jgi:hypothetical protein
MSCVAARRMSLNGMPDLSEMSKRLWWPSERFSTQSSASSWLGSPAIGR